jgi:hypothetical protein
MAGANNGQHAWGECAIDIKNDRFTGTNGHRVQRLMRMACQLSGKKTARVGRRNIVYFPVRTRPITKTDRADAYEGGHTFGVRPLVVSKFNIINRGILTST